MGRLRASRITATSTAVALPRLRATNLVVSGTAVPVVPVGHLRASGVTVSGTPVSTGTPTGRLRASGVTAAGARPSTGGGRLRATGVRLWGGSAVVLDKIAPITSQPLEQVTLTAVALSGVWDTLEWRQIKASSAEPTVTLQGTGASRHFVTPATFDGVTVRIGVRALAGGTTSEEIVAEVTVRPQITWMRNHPDPTWVPGWFTDTPPSGVDEAVHVIVGVIQSNIRGAANDYVTADQYGNPLIQMWRWSDSTITAATEPMSTRDSATGMGAMNTFVKAYAADHPGRRILVINTARGGTGLTTPSTNPSGTAFTWNPAAPDDANNLARSSVTALKGIMGQLPAGSRIVAYLANHGSTDGSNGTPKATFKSLLTSWLTYLRTEMSTPTVPYLMMQMRPSLLGESRHLIIDQGQQEVAADLEWVDHVVSPVGSEFANNDSVHFNAAGVREIGTRLYARFKSVMGV